MPSKKQAHRKSPKDATQPSILDKLPPEIMRRIAEDPSLERMDRIALGRVCKSWRGPAEMTFRTRLSDEHVFKVYHHRLLQLWIKGLQTHPDRATFVHSLVIHQEGTVEGRTDRLYHLLDQVGPTLEEVDIRPGCESGARPLDPRHHEEIDKHITGLSALVNLRALSLRLFDLERLRVMLQRNLGLRSLDLCFANHPGSRIQQQCESLDLPQWPDLQHLDQLSICLPRSGYHFVSFVEKAPSLRTLKLAFEDPFTYDLLSHHDIKRLRNSKVESLEIQSQGGVNGILALLEGPQGSFSNVADLTVDGNSIRPFAQSAVALPSLQHLRLSRSSINTDDTLLLEDLWPFLQRNPRLCQIGSDNVFESIHIRSYTCEGHELVHCIRSLRRLGHGSAHFHIALLDGKVVPIFPTLKSVYKSLGIALGWGGSENSGRGLQLPDETWKMVLASAVWNEDSEQLLWTELHAGDMNFSQ